MPTLSVRRAIVSSFAGLTISLAPTIAASQIPAPGSPEFPVPLEIAVPVAAINYQFAPAEVRITTGTTVAWINGDPVEHTVTQDDLAFDSGSFGLGGVYMLTFTSPGVYQYYCVPHGNVGLVGMSGVVIVEDPLPPTDIPPMDIPPAEPAPEEAPVG